MSVLTLPRPRIDEVPARTETDPPTIQRWVTPALIALLVATAVLYLWGLGSTGWANSFYSAAVQAGTKSWKAFFFGSSDAANFITVDKPPAALWVMELSARLFGVNAWSILVPQALEGVAAVFVLYATVKRWFGAGAGLLAGLVLAATPVAALMFRFNNPDALLVLLLTAGAYAVTRAIESASWRWLALAGALVGFGFLAKMLQAFTVVPAFALAYLVAAPTTLKTRIRDLAISGAAMIAAGGWWVTVVQLVPASARPYVGGSTDNSILNLIFGYNGFGRLSGNETGSVGGGPVGATGGGRWGITGLTRLFGTEMGTTISWLLPAALILLAAGLAITIRHRRTDRTRAALILWGGWLLVTGLVFSLGKGIIHPYYNVALAPAVGAVVAIGAVTLWRRRDLVASRIVLTGALIATTWWSSDLLARTPTWYPWLRGVSLGVAIATAGIILAVGDLGRVARKAVAGLAIAAALTGTAAFTLATVAQAHTGAIPSVGPAGARQVGGPGARFGGAPPGGLQGLPGFGNRPASPGGQGQGQRLTQGSGQGQNLGGLLNGSTPSAAFTAALKQGAHGFTWVAATVGSNEASGYQLATGDPIMALGGFNGTDPYPTLAEFQSLVAAHKVHYFIPGGGPGGGGPGGGGPGGGGPGGGPQATTATTATNTSAAITSWVESTFTAKTVAGVTVYDLSAS